MYYEIKQTTEKKRLLFGTKKVTKVYKFRTLNDAYVFALDEQIKNVFCCLSDKVKTIRKPFKIFYTLEQFIKVSKKNPFHFLGVRNYKKINIKLYYFYLVNSNQLQKLKKFE